MLTRGDSTTGQSRSHAYLVPAEVPEQRFLMLTASASSEKLLKVNLVFFQILFPVL